MKEFLHMNKGDGELSYSQNSVVQKEAWLRNRERLESAIEQFMKLWEERSKSEGLTLNVVDMGCGVGAVPLGVVTFLVEIMQRKWKGGGDQQAPKLVMYMNDLPSNDFNSLFRELLNSEVLKRRDGHGVSSCFLMSAPGSCYDRLFPPTTLHLVHSNYTLHWLSQVPAGIYDEQGIPLNKGNIYISETSPEEVGKAYFNQFEQDFTQFLRCRSEEVVHNGYMLLTFRGRPSATDPLTWTSFELQTLSHALSCLVSQGFIEEEKIDNFNFPCYHPSTDEVESIVKKEGSFAVEDSHTMIVDVAPEIEDKWAKAQFLTRFIRAFSESLLSNHFGEDVMSPLYDKLLSLLFQFLDHDYPTQNHAVTVLLRKKNHA